MPYDDAISIVLAADVAHHAAVHDMAVDFGANFYSSHEKKHKALYFLYFASIGITKHSIG